MYKRQVVRRIIERDDRVAVAADGPSGPVTIEADRVFVAAGAIASTRIVLESLGLWDRPVRLATTQGFGLPILLPPGMIVYTRPTSLASLFIESRLADSPHWVHTQIGPVNQLTQTELARRLKRLPVGDALATLVARLRARWDTETALRAFADDLDDVTGDLVAANLILAARRRNRSLSSVLQGVAESVAEGCAPISRIIWSRPRSCCH